MVLLYLFFILGTPISLGWRKG